MGLEFIDISREEEYEGLQVRNAVSRRTSERQRSAEGQRMSEQGRRRRYEGQRLSEQERRRRSEGQRVSEQERRRRPEGQYISSEQERGRRTEGERIPSEQARRRKSGGQRVSSEQERRRRPEAQRIAEQERRQRFEEQSVSLPVQRRRTERQSTAAPARKRRPEAEIYQIPDNRDARRRAREAELREEQVRARRRKRRKRKMIAARMITLGFLVLLIAGAAFLLVKIISGLRNPEEITTGFSANIQPQEVVQVNDAEKPIITEDFIPVNEFSRPGEVLPEVNNIFVHYTANPGTSAAQNRSYFENLGITGETSASAHFVIGYDGEIIQCVPLNEIAYAVAGRNYDSISIECCYLSDDGRFTNDTYHALIRLSAWLLDEYNLTPEDMRRHYDEGGKKCPLYFVEHEDAWEQFLKDLQDYIAKEQV